MTAAAGSEVPVGAPVLEEPITGILAQVPVVTGPEADRWFAGMQFSPEVSGAPEFRDLCSTVALAGTANREAPRQVHPFSLTVRDRCSTFGWQAADYEGRATRALQAKRTWGVEREFEKGELIGTNLHLADTYVAPDPTTVELASGANVSPSDALALLDEAIGNSANVIGRGMIWATPFVAAKWAAAGMLSDMQTEDGRTVILSPAGNYVIIGGGFEGRGPDGNVVASHASQWAYATDPVVVVASSPTTLPSTLAEATDKETNTVVYRQTQFFAILWSGLLHAAVKISSATPTVT
jgi:hypothetical protein